MQSCCGRPRVGPGRPRLAARVCLGGPRTQCLLLEAARYRRAVGDACGAGVCYGVRSGLYWSDGDDDGGCDDDGCVSLAHYEGVSPLPLPLLALPRLPLLPLLSPGDGPEAPAGALEILFSWWQPSSFLSVHPVYSNIRE